MTRSLLVRVVLVLAPIAMQGAADAKAADPCAEYPSVYDELRDAENCAQFVGLVDPQQSQEQVVTDAIAICKRKLVRIYEAGWTIDDLFLWMDGKDKSVTACQDGTWRGAVKINDQWVLLPAGGE